MIWRRSTDDGRRRMNVAHNPADLNLAELAERFGPIPFSRVRPRPRPGQATAADLVREVAGGDKFLELIDGVLLEKPVGFPESVVAGLLLARLNAFVLPRRLGICSGPDGGFLLEDGLIRLPDLAFIAAERLPPDWRNQPVLACSPTLAVEIVSPGNTREELARKREDYFQAGVLEVWEVDRVPRECRQYTGPNESRTLQATDRLNTCQLPGFEFPVGELFALSPEL